MNQKETTPMQVTYHLPSFFPPLMGPLKPFFWSQRYFQRTRRWTKRKGGEGGWNFKIYDINVHINKYIIWCIYIIDTEYLYYIHVTSHEFLFVCWLLKMLLIHVMSRFIIYILGTQLSLYSMSVLGGAKNYPWCTCSESVQVPYFQVSTPNKLWRLS